MKQVSKSRRQPSAGGEIASTLIGRQLLEAGKLSEHDIARVVAAQREGGILFGDAAVGLGLITREDVDAAFARQHRYPYLSGESSNLSPLLVAAHDPSSRAVEAIRTLRSQLMLRWFGDRKKSLAVTSGRSGEGASVLAANLAIVFAQLGERTLLIDANLRNPRQHELFGIRTGVGLSNVLTDRSSSNDVLTAVPPFDNLAVLCAGMVPPNPQELLGRIGFSYLVETAPAAFDIVIIDTPPILDYADAQIVASCAGACLLSVHRHKTRLEDIEQVKQMLVPSGAVMVGAVING